MNLSKGISLIIFTVTAMDSLKLVFPDHTTITSLTNNFGKYFADKIAKLRSGLSSTDADPPVPHKNKFLSGSCQRRGNFQNHQVAIK